MKSVLLREDVSEVTAIDYGLIASLIAVVIITATLVGMNLTTTLREVSSAL